ncbi:hypothetical protein ACIT1K_002667 [Raoultella planticola]|jgi:hypothetical protein|uniref:hypothetical protein n=1 Tax=Klebsiella pneumoniae complex TaxID=3390273 RepID=UPI001034C79D|nr:MULTISPECIES: hypothetical protein [Klebsiella]DAW19948.1 MAG TPA: hypothetical protein [Caudoviricetes sp.]HDE1982408.1 hypothetical protein [Klebsiella quasipneumoniae]EIX9704106.1 hypothetical protein [Klebsiella pneumoniae]EKZ9845828.1 hypothetical protein [Klebsiella pneumoniae]MBC5001857.1 hypothetical protein [Klebsiella pneumoniae]
MTPSIVFEGCRNVKIGNLSASNGGGISITNSIDIDIGNLESRRTSGMLIDSSERISIEKGRHVDVEKPFTIKKSKKVKIKKNTATNSTSRKGRAFIQKPNQGFMPRQKILSYLIRVILNGY